MKGLTIKVLSLCLLTTVAGSCVKRQSVRQGAVAGNTAYEPVGPSSLSQYMRTVYKLSSEASHKQTEERAKLLSESPELADLAARIEHDPKDGDARSQLATAYINHQLYWAAYELLTDSQEVNLEDVDTNLNLARIWDVWAEYDLALKHAERAIDNGASSSSAYELMGRIYLHRKAPSEAIGWYERAARQADNATVLANLGYAYLLLSDWEKARTSLTRAIELDRTLPEPHNNLALVLMKLGDEKAALSELLKTAKAPVAFNNMGFLYLKERNFDEAQAFFKEALSLDPQYEIAQRNLSAVQAATPPAAIIHLPSFGVHNSGNGIVTATCPEPEKANSPTMRQDASSPVLVVERDVAGSRDIIEPDPLPSEQTTDPKAEVAEVVKPLGSEASELTVEKPTPESTEKTTEQTSDVVASLPPRTTAPESENRPAPEEASIAIEAQNTACMYSSEFALPTPSNWNVNLENRQLIMGGGLVLLLAASATAIRVRGSRKNVQGL